ncbi:PASTA domain [Fusobacterium necrophorum subsp. necrophorum]|nr:PASTA domain [Fusobacterium necrophorum subsp. necrophorum]
MQKGSKISFLVSGSASSSDLNLKVPDVIGYPVEDAKFILEAEQLLLGNIIKKPSEETEAGIVLGTSIPVGRNVNLSTKIDLIVSE